MAYILRGLNGLSDCTVNAAGQKLCTMGPTVLTTPNPGTIIQNPSGTTPGTVVTTTFPPVASGPFYTQWWGIAGIGVLAYLAYSFLGKKKPATAS